jgi:hypothetical protein
VIKENSLLTSGTSCGARAAQRSISPSVSRPLCAACGSRAALPQSPARWTEPPIRATTARRWPSPRCRPLWGWSSRRRWGPHPAEPYPLGRDGPEQRTRPRRVHPCGEVLAAADRDRRDQADARSLRRAPERDLPHDRQVRARSGTVRYRFSVSTLREADYPYAPANSRRVTVTVGPG